MQFNSHQNPVRSVLLSHFLQRTKRNARLTDGVLGSSDGLKVTQPQVLNSDLTLEPVGTTILYCFQRKMPMRYTHKLKKKKGTNIFLEYRFVYLYTKKAGRKPSPKDVDHLQVMDFEGAFVFFIFSELFTQRFFCFCFLFLLFCFLFLRKGFQEILKGTTE